MATDIELKIMATNKNKHGELDSLGFEDFAYLVRDGTSLHQISERLQDAIQIYDYLTLPDNFGFQKRPLYQPFLQRNLLYMRRIKKNNYETEEEGCHKEGSPDLLGEMPTTIQFNFVRNNYYFDDFTAIVHCLHTSAIENKYEKMKSIPSASFEMEVNNRISQVSIDLPHHFFAKYMNMGQIKFKSSLDYFVVRVVFRYETFGREGRQLRRLDKSKDDAPFSKCSTHNVVMFGAKPIVTYSEKTGTHILKGEVSIPLFSSEELELDCEHCLRKEFNAEYSANLLERIQKLQRKPYDVSAFVSLEIRDMMDEEEEHPGTLLRARIKYGRTKQSTAFLKNYQPEAIIYELPGKSAGDFNFLSHDPQRCHSVESCSNLSMSSVSTPNYRRSFSSDDVSRPSTSSMSDQQPHKWNQFPYNNARDAECPFPNPELHLSLFGLMAGIDSDKVEKESPNGDENILRRSSRSLRAFNTGRQKQTIIRVVSSSSKCYFCRTAFCFNNLSSLLHHLRCSHPRLKFTYRFPLNNYSSRSAVISVHVDPNFDTSFELTPMRHYFKALSRKALRISFIEPFWIVTKNFAKYIREVTIDNFFKNQYDTPHTDSTLSIGTNLHTIDINPHASDPIQSGTSSKLDQKWLLEKNLIRLKEITDVHPTEVAFMKIWNEFVLNVRMTMLGQNMIYDALEIFVDRYRDVITGEKGLGQNLCLQFLLHLTALMNAGCIDNEERYQLFLRLRPVDRSKTSTSCSDHVYRWSILHDKRVQTEQVQNFAERTVLTNISTRSRLIRKTRNRT